MARFGLMFVAGRSDATQVTGPESLAYWPLGKNDPDTVLADAFVILRGECTQTVLLWLTDTAFA